mgnify:CR=1 FL=1
MNKKGADWGLIGEDYRKMRVVLYFLIIILLLHIIFFLSFKFSSSFEPFSVNGKYFNAKTDQLRAGEKKITVVSYLPALKSLKIRSIDELLRTLQDFLRILEEFLNNFQGGEIDNYQRNDNWSTVDNANIISGDKAAFTVIILPPLPGNSVYYNRIPS